MGKLDLTGNSNTRARLASSPSAPAFDVVNDIGWAHLFYAGGPAFIALGLSDGASMSSTNWPDEIAANAANLTGGSGTYQAANAAMNSKPAVLVPASGSGKMHTGTVAGGAQVSLPYSIIVIFDLTSSAPTRYVTDGANEGNSGQRVLFRITAGPVWSLYMGSDNTGGTPTTGIKAARIYATSGNDTLTVNGSTIISGVSSGGGTWQGVSFSPTPSEMAGRHALYGLYSGDITAAGNWAGLVSWVSSNYGVTLS